MIELRSIERKFFEGKPTEVAALRGVNLTINDGEMTAIMGPSGSGKSTLLHILALLDSHYTGEFIYNGTDVSSLGDSKKAKIRNREIGLVMQDYGLVGEMTALTNVEIPLIIAGEGGRAARKKAEAALDEVSLSHRAKYAANLLSGGERQRVAIARAIVMGAQLLLADEPTGAVDGETTDEIIGLMRRLNMSGVTVVIVTHDAAVASMCDRTVRLTKH
ncbi:MAG: ABC transporter ATP-binding protein [Firmicutes bacterium]|nr:ABC transporter ATP-binding protein [Bacillota bacterium]MCD7783738.1 ABC transporter ATP-binding protein [Bacillota bacterium]MCD8315611.1 ABC transporter ATP-binding protein [Bacillota bacterium]